MPRDSLIDHASPCTLGTHYFYTKRTFHTPHNDFFKNAVQSKKRGLPKKPNDLHCNLCLQHLWLLNNLYTTTIHKKSMFNRWPWQRCFIDTRTFEWWPCPPGFVEMGPLPVSYTVRPHSRLIHVYTHQIKIVSWDFAKKEFDQLSPL